MDALIVTLKESQKDLHRWNMNVVIAEFARIVRARPTERNARNLGHI